MLVSVIRRPEFDESVPFSCKFSREDLRGRGVVRFGSMGRLGMKFDLVPDVEEATLLLGRLDGL